MRRHLRKATLPMYAILLAVLLAAIPGRAQDHGPVGKIVATAAPISPDGVRALIDLPASLHMKNRGGNDRTRTNPRGLPGRGYGLCVFTSIEHAARWQNVRALTGFQEWMTRHSGGGWPEKVDQMVAEFCRDSGRPDPLYAQHTGGDVGFLLLAVRTGRMPGVTYCGQDDFYGGQVIAHMVNLAHLDDARAAIIDNNRPGQWVWMTRDEFVVRWKGNSGGWAVVLLDPPPPPGPSPAAYGLIRGDVYHYADADQGGPGLVGQCPGGVCPVPPGSPFTPGTRVPLTPPRAVPVPGEWVQYAGEKRWAYRSGDRFVAVCDAEGRCTEVDAHNHITDKVVDPPAPIPAGAAAPPCPNYGVRQDKVHQLPSYSVSGSKVTREQMFAALAPLTDDSDRWHVTAVGDDGFQARVRGDVGRLPDATRAKLHLQTYGPADWPVSMYALPPGVSLRKPTPGRQAADVGRVGAEEYSPTRLQDLMQKPGGPTPAPPPPPAQPAPVKPDPVPPAPPPPFPVPAPLPPGPSPSLPLLAANLAALGSLLTILGVFLRRRPAS